MADIKLEIPSENAVLEIQYDGTELLQQPSSMSENLTQLARKIDFGSNDGEEIKSEEKENEEEEKPFQQPHWSLESVRNKIRNSLTEVCVLHDLLQIVKDKRYMVLDPVQSSHVESKQYMQFLALKKSLNGGSVTLLSGAERLRSSQVDLGRGRQPLDFHIELLRLRQNWKLRKVGSTILGDLSYRALGSSYRHQAGLFEVTKADDSSGPNSSLSTAGGLSPMSPLQASSSRSSSSLKVTVPADLEGSSYIFVCIRKDEEDICSTKIQSLPFVSRDGHWQQKLECAQNVLFCNELFSQLAREAVSLQPPIPHLVVGNQITSTIFPGIHLLITLCHSEADRSQKKKLSSGSSPFSGSGAGGTSGPAVSVGLSKSNHDEVLEHSLHQLFHRSFLSTSSAPLPQPVYGPVGVPKKRRVAGPEGLSRNELQQSIQSETILEQIISQAQHNFLRLRTMYVIDQLALELKDPLIISHWDLINSPTQSCVRINIVTQGYDSVLRTSLVISIYEKSLKCICRDGKIMNLSFEPQELRNLLFCQISLHNVAAVQCFARYMGWTVISSESAVGVGAAEPLGNASAVVLSSPPGTKLLAVRSSPTKGVTVFVCSSPRNDFYPSAVVGDRRWENFGGAWHEVRLERLDGRNFLNKIELLMAALTAQA